MRTFVILVGLSVVVVATSQVAADDLSFYSPYEILTDHPGCKGPDRVALHVKFNVESTATYLYEGKLLDAVVNEQCTITSRKGTTVVTSAIPCSDGIASASLSDETRMALERLSQLPETVTVAGEIFQCLLPEEKFIGGASRNQMTLGGSWTAQIPESTGFRIEGDEFSRRWPSANFERSRTELLFDGRTFVTIPPHLRVFIGPTELVDNTDKIRSAVIRTQFNLNLVPLFDVDCDIGGDKC